MHNDDVVVHADSIWQTSDSKTDGGGAGYDCGERRREGDIGFVGRHDEEEDGQLVVDIWMKGASLWEYIETEDGRRRR